ncbi:hypothetical protein IHQ11_17065 [Priestia megaterium]|uniref:hypothetical protein n=1 Tax=Priestia megaterium TaxID=1404 RepID=UPI001B3A29F3|nr:hypothetical protein [Priestia megaterium]MBQ4868208.1 hypothetical protein [Priestia megaterium]
MLKFKVVFEFINGRTKELKFEATSKKEVISHITKHEKFVSNEKELVHINLNNVVKFMVTEEKNNNKVRINNFLSNRIDKRW